MLSLSGQVAWITGGGRGIGRAAAITVADLGAVVAVSARTSMELDETVDEIQGRAEAFVCDVSDWQSVIEAVGQIEARLGPIDILINNAGVLGPLARAWESPPREWARAIEINLIGAYYCTRAVLPGMVARRRGTIVNVSSGAATSSAPNWSAYAASKAGLDHLTRLLATELKDMGVRVNCLHPGIVETAMVKTLRTATPEQLPPHRRRFFEDATEKREVLEPETAGRMIAWLASDAAADLDGMVLDARDDPSVVARAEKALNG